MDYSLLQVLQMMVSLTLTPLGGPASADITPVPAAKPSIPLFQQAPLSQWPRVLADHEALMASYRACLSGNGACDNNVSHWQAFLRTQARRRPLEQLVAVNEFMNARPYKQDNWLYNVSDYWAGVDEFLKNSGDCEDFAIAKYFSLRQLGFDPNAMQIMLVYDVYSGTDHAVLRVALDDKIYFLDNREDLIDRAGFEKRYRPHIAFNENDVYMFDRPLMARAIRGGDERILPGNR